MQSQSPCLHSLLRRSRGRQAVKLEPFLPKSFAPFFVHRPCPATQHPTHMPLHNYVSQHSQAIAGQVTLNNLPGKGQGAGAPPQEPNPRDELAVSQGARHARLCPGSDLPLGQSAPQPMVYDCSHSHGLFYPELVSACGIPHLSAFRTIFRGLKVWEATGSFPPFPEETAACSV